jgi:hypothetical protein
MRVSWQPYACGVSSITVCSGMASQIRAALARNAGRRRLLVAGRQRMSDEEYVAGGRAMPDNQYLEEGTPTFSAPPWRTRFPG